MTGQFPVETAPLVADIDGDGTPEIVALNQGGQLLVWAPDGSPVGSGPDGTLTQLPDGRWTTTPTLLDAPTGVRVVACSVEGLVVALDRNFKRRWRFALPGKTMWARAVPAIAKTPASVILCFADASGTATALSCDGKRVWAQALDRGPCRAPLQAFRTAHEAPRILVPVGTTLCCLDADGNVRWQRDLGGRILTRPELLPDPEHPLILCGAGAGALFALTLNGEVVWKADIGDEIDASIAFLPRSGAPPLVLCTGLWGNLHAIDPAGRHVWTHRYRAKGRGAPLVLDVDGDGDSEIIVSTYAQHVYVFDDNGHLVDDVRLNGLINASPVPLPDPRRERTGVLLTTALLLAYRLGPGTPESPYGAVGRPTDVRLHPWLPACASETPGLIVDNPHGALIRVNVAATDAQGEKRIVGRMTRRSRMEIPLTMIADAGPWKIRATAHDPAGRLLVEETWSVPEPRAATSNPVGTGALVAWPTPPYGTFDDQRLAPMRREGKPGDEQGVRVPTLYVNEIDQGALIVASMCDKPVRARVLLEPLIRADKTAFHGAIVLREAVPIGTVNGERVADALPALGDAGLITVPVRRAVKIWISVDAHGAQPGAYRGRIVIKPLARDVESVQLPLTIKVLDLQMPPGFPLTVCTWDYVPNNWFHSRLTETLDDMTRHGVNVFPRSSMPKARANAEGQLTFDWSVLDAELARLHGRGTILFHVTHPPIRFAAEPSARQKHDAELTYFRMWRDHIASRGWGYEDYALYPIDEPGLALGKRVPAFLDAATLFRAADPKLRIYTDPVPKLSWKDYERIEPFIDVWCPNMRLVSGLLSGDPRIRRIMKTGRPVWSYECVSQVKTLSPLRYNRANAWRAKYFGLDGIGTWTHSTTRIDHWFGGKPGDDEYALVYPGEIPIPSVRWEALRDGLEDVAAIEMLQRAVEAGRANPAERAHLREAEEVLRLAQTDIMELSDAAFVESRDYLRQGDRVIGHTWTDVETYPRHRARIAALTLAFRGGPQR